MGGNKNGHQENIRIQIWWQTYSAAGHGLTVGLSSPSLRVLNMNSQERMIKTGGKEHKAPMHFIEGSNLPTLNVLLKIQVEGLTNITERA